MGSGKKRNLRDIADAGPRNGSGTGGGTGGSSAGGNGPTCAPFLNVRITKTIKVKDGHQVDLVRHDNDVEVKAGLMTLVIITGQRARGLIQCLDKGYKYVGRIVSEKGERYAKLRRTA